jgi:hypothetical protein
MKNTLKNQKGFAPLETIFILIMIGVIVLVGYLVYKKHQDNEIKLPKEIKSYQVLQNSSDSTWSLHTFGNNQYKFSDYFPCNPGVVKINATDDSNQQYVGYAYVCKYESSGIVYEILANVYANNVIAKLPPPVLNNSASATNERIISTSKLTIDGNDAQTLDYTAYVGNQKAYGNSESIVKKNVLYTVVSTSLNTPNSKSNYFISNFQVL